MTILLFSIFVLIVLLFFVSRKLSPVPYFPSEKRDLPLIVKALNLKNGQTVVDLGAGDGIVIFAAAWEAWKHKLNARFVAVEINPFLVLVLQLRKLFHPNGKSIRIILADMFKIDLRTVISNGSERSRNDIIVFLYISPWYMKKVYKNLKKDLKSFKLVSYFYPLPNKKSRKTIKGKNQIFAYTN